MTEAVNTLPEEEFDYCYFCQCVFLTKSDLIKHVDKFGREPHEEAFKRLHRKTEAIDEEETEQIVWHKAKFGTGRITKAVNDPALARSIEQQGPVRMGMYLHTLSNDKKWIIRKLTTE